MEKPPSLWNFLKLFYAEWASLVTGSFSAILFLLGLGLSMAVALGYPVPGGPIAQVATWMLAIASSGRAAYLIWAREHKLRVQAEEKLIPKLVAVFHPNKPPWRDQVKFGDGRRAVAYRIQIKHLGGETINNCEGQLIEIAFRDEMTELGTTILTWCGEYPLKTKIDLNAGFTRELDVLLLFEDGGVAITTPGWPPNNRQNFFSRQGHYRFSVVIGGHGSSALPPYKLRLNYTGDWQTSTMEVMS